MEQVAKCKSLVAIFRDDKIILGGPHEVSFDIEKNVIFRIDIEQCGIRKISLTSDVDVSVLDLYAIFSCVEKLLMLFDGVFISLSKIQLSESDTFDEKILHSWEEHFMKGRLSYYMSADFCNYSIEKMLQFDSIISADLFRKWEYLLDELGVVHQMYLYFLSNSGITVDIKCAFLIELAEPLVEIVKKHTNQFTLLTPGARGTSLRKCLDALINRYGVDIFKCELLSNYENFLSTLVNSRVRIMHIKCEHKGMYFNGEESVLYALKISLLYRKILFEVLNIDEANYRDNLKKCVSKLNKWNDNLDKFLIKLSK